MKKLCHSLALGALVLAPHWAPASPSSALREYKDGKYEQATKEYERLLEKKSDDPRLHFNAGAAAYRNRQFDQAVKQFDEALGAPDLKLQGLSYYNRGNSLYYLGESNSDPNQRTEAWEKSLKDYELSLKLNPQDADAKFNHQFVEKKLEELKQQQQQQNKSGQDKQNQQKNEQNDQSKQDQQQQSKDQKNDQSKQDQQQQQQQQQQNQSSQKQDSSPQNSQQQQKKSDAQQEQAAKSAQDQKDKQASKPQQANQASGQKKDKSEDKAKDTETVYAPGQMTPEQAEQLLDAQKGEEMMLPVKPEGKPADHSRPFKDW